MGVHREDVRCGIIVLSDQLLVVMPRLAVVAQTRPRVGRDPDLPLLVDGGGSPSLRIVWT